MKVLCIPVIFLIALTSLALHAYDSKMVFASGSYDITVPDDFALIQEAIDASQPAQRIYVRSGIYREYLAIEKPVSIEGENASTTIIEGNGTKVLVSILADNVTFSGFSIKNAETGIALKNVKNCKITNNSITNIRIFSVSTQGMGVHVDGCNRIMISQNFMRDIYYNAVFFIKTSNSQIAKNVFIANTRWSQPVFLFTSDSNKIMWNQVLGLSDMNEGGIGLLESNNNTVAYNNILQNDWVGISINSSNHTIVKGNNIVDHTWWGMIIIDSCDVIVYCNDFIDNNMQLYLDNAVNISWDYAGYGNFWSDYLGEDENNDGVGEAPYINDGDQIDDYPLMGRCSFFELQKSQEIFLLEILSNSTISGFADFSSVSSDGRINFSISGPPISYGFSIIKVPHGLMQRPYGVLVDGVPPLLFKEWINGQDSTILYFQYSHEDEPKRVTLCTRLRTDLNIDGVIGIDDLIIAAEAFWSTPEHPRWNSHADIDQDARVRIDDLVMIAQDFGESWP
jgi:nitrous oxidase accessory protein